MNFNSAAFLIFLPVVVLVYWVLPGKVRKFWLLAASYFFYAWWNPLLLLLILASTAIDYCCSRGMEKFDDRPKLRKVLLLVSIFMNLGLLFFFKYWDFFARSASSLFGLIGLKWTAPQLNLILPVGISFYTFQTMSYSIDVYRRKISAEHDPISFALYVTFFPQLVAGPIENARDLLPQLKKVHTFSRDDFIAGLRLLLSGFFRKCAVADLCGRYVAKVFQNPGEANGFAIFVGGALFCFQMYCDFAGYSEIAAGSARLMGVRLMKNFDQPYISQSYGEFFRRWHISLNRWFTQYLYIPLGGNRKGPARRVINTLIVFALCGLWHGANWTYVLWGLYAAFFVCMESVLAKPAGTLAAKWKIPLENPFVKFFRRCYMFLIFVPAAILFRADSVSQLGVLFPRLFTAGFGIPEGLSFLGIGSFEICQIALALIAMALLPRFAEYDLPAAKNDTAKARRLCYAVCLLVVIALSWLALLATEDIAGFAYFQF